MGIFLRIAITIIALVCAYFLERHLVRMWIKEYIDEVNAKYVKEQEQKRLERLKKNKELFSSVHGERQ